jgi:hypothetical protein
MIAIPILWLHILSIIGAFGVLLGYQMILPKDMREQAEASRAIGKIVNWMVMIGFLAGLTYYFARDGLNRGPHYNGIIAVKFLMLLGVGALVAISKNRPMADALRWGAIILIAIAALFGLTIELPDA